ncbi:MAG: acyl-CoA thioesterase [Clostridia bacterium]|jgi:acyl-CoA thioester hydrolase
MVTHETSFRVRYKETDQMGIVHHTNYYVWFEVGRTECMRDMGLGYREIEERGFLFPLLETHCSYKVPAKYDDLVTIRTRISEIKGARITFTYEVIRNDDGALLAEGRTVHCFVDSNMKPINIRKADEEIYSLLQKGLNG